MTALQATGIGFVFGIIVVALTAWAIARGQR